MALRPVSARWEVGTVRSAEENSACIAQSKDDRNRTGMTTHTWNRAQVGRLGSNGKVASSDSHRHGILVRPATGATVVRVPGTAAAHASQPLCWPGRFVCSVAELVRDRGCSGGGRFRRVRFEWGRARQERGRSRRSTLPICSVLLQGHDEVRQLRGVRKGLCALMILIALTDEECVEAMIRLSVSFD